LGLGDFLDEISIVGDLYTILRQLIYRIGTMFVFTEVPANLIGSYSVKPIADGYASPLVSFDVC